MSAERAGESSTSLGREGEASEPLPAGTAATGGAPVDLESHDWGSDARWQRYLQGVELPAQPGREAAALRRLKRKYWQRYVVGTPRGSGAVRAHTRQRDVLCSLFLFNAPAGLVVRGGAVHVQDPSATFPSDSPSPVQGNASAQSSESPNMPRPSSGGGLPDGGAEPTSGRAGSPREQGSSWSWGLGPAGAADVAANASVVVSALVLLFAGVSSAYRWLLLSVCATCAIHIHRGLGVPRPSSSPFLSGILLIAILSVLASSRVYGRDAPRHRCLNSRVST
jgi:hypothetical protein